VFTVAVFVFFPQLFIQAFVFIHTLGCKNTNTSTHTLACQCHTHTLMHLLSAPSVLQGAGFCCLLRDLQAHRIMARTKPDQTMPDQDGPRQARRPGARPPIYIASEIGNENRIRANRATRTSLRVYVSTLQRAKFLIQIQSCNCRVPRQFSVLPWNSMHTWLTVPHITFYKL